MNRLLQTLLIVCFVFIFGCNPETENKRTTKDYDNLTTQMSTNDQLSSNEALATHLAEVAAKVPKVDQATALIAGPYTVVGIDVDENLDRSTVGIIKYSVSEALRNDSYGKTAIVIADGDIRQRLKNMQKSIANGQPIQGIIDELAAIVGRYMPSMPPKENHLINNEQENITTDDQEEKLEDIQEEHSTE